MNNDRFTTRINIHALIVKTPCMSAGDIRLKLIYNDVDSVRRALDWLILNGNITQEGRYKGARFFPTDTPLMSIQQMLDQRLKDYKARVMPPRLKQQTKAQIDKTPQPWRTLNLSKDRDPIRNQGGQGCLPMSLRRGCTLS